MPKEPEVPWEDYDDTPQAGALDETLTDVPQSSSDPNGRWRDGPLLWDDKLPRRAFDRLWNDPEAKVVRQYLMSGKGGGPGGSDGRGFSHDTVEHWKLGAHRDRSGVWWVTIPLRDQTTREVVNIKFCRVPDQNGERPKPKYVACRDRPLPLFGVLVPPEESGSVVIVEGELDVIAMHQYGWERNVVTSTAGAGTFSPEWLEQIEPYRSFVLLLDGDETGDKGATSLSEKLGKYRCERAKLPHKDPNQCLLEGVEAVDIEIAIERAKPYVGVEVKLAGDYEEAFEELVANPHRLIGRPTGSDKLDQIFAGWGDGLNVVTGPSGTGKTTWLAWASWAAALVGVPVCYIPLEQSPLGMIQKFVRMEMEADFLDFTKAERSEAFARLRKRPLRVLNRYGFITMEELVETIRYQRRRNGVEVFMLDHLGFMVRPGDDERRQIDDIVRTLAKTGVDEGVAINMIAHPDKSHRKDGGRPVEFGDLKGSSAIEQDAAMGLIIERLSNEERAHAFVRVGKLRKEWGQGKGGNCVQYFDAPSCLYADHFHMLPGGGSNPGDQR